MPITHTTVLPAPPERVWAWLEEPERQKKWMKGVVANVCTSDDPHTAGATFEMQIEEGRKVAVYEAVYTHYEPHRHLALDITGGSFQDSVMHVDYRLQDLGGRTRLDYEADVTMESPSLWTRLMTPLFIFFGKLQYRRFVKTLAAELEAESPTATA